MHVPSQVFKRHMDAFLGPLFACLDCQHQLCRAAAGRCAGALRDFVGPGIFAGHLTDEQAALLASSPEVPAPRGVQPCLTPKSCPTCCQHASVLLQAPSLACMWEERQMEFTKAELMWNPSRQPSVEIGQFDSRERLGGHCF